MPWANDPDARRKSAQTYSDPEYVRNKRIVRRRSGGRCEHPGCGSRLGVQCDHKIPRSQGGTHQLENLWDLCGYHHRQKTATEGGGFRKPAGDPQPVQRTRW